MAPAPGLTGSANLVVADDDTAIAHGSGTVPVLATPRVVALCEAATVDAVAAALDEGTTTVGVQVQLDHISPSGVGSAVAAEATVDKVAGRKLFFTVSARDDRGLIAAGKVTRVVVDTEEFLAKCRS